MILGFDNIAPLNLHFTFEIMLCSSEVALLGEYGDIWQLKMWGYLVIHMWMFAGKALTSKICKTHHRTLQVVYSEYDK